MSDALDKWEGCLYLNDPAQAREFIRLIAERGSLPWLWESAQRWTDQQCVERAKAACEAAKLKCLEVQ